MLRRLFPVLVLMVLSPLTAEYLGGNMAFSQLGLLPVLMLLYGGGAVLIRELACRHKRRFAVMLLLGLAYGILEEGAVFQSLFNPNFEGAHLLDYGFLPALSLAVPWTIYVLAIHVIWSISVPVVVTECLFLRRREEPWLGKPGLFASAAIYLTGFALILATMSRREHFMASWPQLSATALAAALCVAAAFGLPAPARKILGAAPRPRIVLLAAFAGGSAFILLYRQGAFVQHWPWQAVTAGMAAIMICASALGFGAGRFTGWSEPHRFALAAGAVLVYCWTGLLDRARHWHGPDVAFQAALVTAMLLMLLVIAFRLRRMDQSG